MKEIENHLGKLRRERQISVADLAAAVGLTRQAVNSIELGNYIPNTAVALKLAQVLQTSVEALFSLPEPKPELHRALFLPGGGDPAPGQPVQLCQVDNQLIASAPSPWNPFLPVADASVIESGRSGKPKLQIFSSEKSFDDRILVAGCDPGLSVLARFAQKAGIELVLAHRNSSQALELLKAGQTHVAGTHLGDNVPTVQKLFPKTSVAVISVAVWEQGILTAPNNAKGIRGIEDLARPDVRMANREKGSGSRALLDAQLEKLGVETSRIHGYDTVADGHLPAAWQVYSGAVDCCIATRAAARVFGLHFIPLAVERYDFAVRKQSLENPRIQNLFDIFQSAGFRRQLEGLTGYDTSVAGDRLL